jgi:spermidine synthase
MNAAVALWALWLFRHELRRRRAHARACALCSAVLLAASRSQVPTDHHAGRRPFYQDRWCFTATSPYQRIVVTRRTGQGRAGHRLFLNGNLQFAERDEYRYHEALVHPAMAATARPKTWRCWAAATAWRCARSSSTPSSKASRWWSWTRP